MTSMRNYFLSPISVFSFAWWTPPTCVLLDSFFPKIFFFFNVNRFLKSLLNLLCFGFLVKRPVGSQLPDQRSGLHPLHWKAKS